MCEPWQNPKTLEQRKTNLIVALPLKMLKGRTEEYCGKEIIANFNGKTVSGLIAWDGCVACDGNVSIFCIPFEVQTRSSPKCSVLLGLRSSFII